MAEPVRDVMTQSGRVRTLFVTQWFDPEPGAMRGLPLAKWLSARGHDIEVLTGFPNYPGGKVYPGYRIRWRQRETMESIPVVRVPLYPSHDGSAVRRIANYLTFAASASTIGIGSVGSADVGYIYNPPTVGLPGLVLKGLRGLPFIYHIGDMWPESVTESGMVGRGRLRRIAENAIHAWCDLVYRHSAAITVLSPGFKRILVERGVPSDKVEVIYNWTDEQVFRPLDRDETLARSLGFEGRFNVVYAGNMGVFQGLDTVIRAAARLRDVPEIQFVLAGTGPQEATLKALAEELGAANVRFLGRRQYWEMPVINALADVLVVHLRDLPIFASTIPSKTQVSLASGRPVLMAVRGDAADVIRASSGGLTCAPDNPQALAETVERFYQMAAQERARMGEAGRAYYLKEMSLDRGGSQMDALCRRLAGLATAA